jgi:hypothetical protein
VTIAGELEGNVEQASHVDLLQSGVVIGDLKTGHADGRVGCPHARSSRIRLGRRQGPRKPASTSALARRAAPAHEHRAPGRARRDARLSALSGRRSSRVLWCARPAGTICAMGWAPTFRQLRPRSRRCASKGSIRHPPRRASPGEYTVVVSILQRSRRGDRAQVDRVGAMNPNEQRTFTLSVEAVSARAKTPGKRRHAALRFPLRRSQAAHMDGPCNPGRASSASADSRCSRPSGPAAHSATLIPPSIVMSCPVM